MATFLTIKHWQLFLVVIGIPLTLEIINNAMVLFGSGEIYTLQAVMKFLMVIPFLTFYFWLWSSGILINNQIKEKLETGTSYFSLAVFTSAFSTFFLLVYVFYLSENWDTLMVEKNLELDATLTYIIFGVVLFLALATLLLSISYLAKTIVRAEREAHITSSDYYSEFIMAVFFPIGIWILQPRINALYEKFQKTNRTST